jgi:hypothetical protein
MAASNAADDCAAVYELDWLATTVVEVLLM